MALAAGHELDAPPWQRVEATLMATSRAIRRAYDKRLDPLGLNLTEASILAYVNQHGAITQTRLARHLGVGRASMGAAIDVLHRTKALDHKAIRDAIAETQLATIVGPVNWKTGPVKNVSKTPLVGGQWQKSGAGLDLTVTSNKQAPQVPLGGSMKSLV